MITLTQREAIVGGAVWTILEVRGQTYGLRDEFKAADMFFGYPKDLYEASKAFRRIPETVTVPTEALDEDWGKYERRWQKAYPGTIDQNANRIASLKKALKLDVDPYERREETPEENFPF